jgi:hypothetical protein
MTVIQKQKLFEMPYLITGRLNVPLQNDVTNLQTLTQIQASKPITLDSDVDGTLYFVPKSGGGQYAFVSKQKIPKIEYFMEFKEQQSTGVLKNAATQIMIWNRLGPVGLTSRVFFDRMLHKYDTMISDDQQSVDGQRFWLRQLRESLKRGFVIGMLDGDRLHGYDPADDFDAWIASLDAWGQDANHWFRRFFITAGTVLLHT